MESTFFSCQNLYAYMGFAAANSFNAIQNTSKYDIELHYRSLTSGPVSDSMPGFRLQPGESICFISKSVIDIYRRNWFKNQNTYAFGIILVSNYSPYIRTASEYITRVVNAGGTVEALDCLNTALINYGFK